ncbi:hypothetical protein [Pseudobutyrivibrio sp. MD2005]|uniref:hypothetical protein n=1 Tax=Pseudobutyrivibrio sp. MD2005 TaxID=1410616 RepID=UPI0012DFA609|nr:hypothetical protein [Pseudobutyrivibrio sp. MD2005]
MIRRSLKKCIIALCMCLLLSQSIYAKEANVKSEPEQKQEQVADSEESTVDISDEKVPLGLKSEADFARYKRSVVVMVVFGGMIVIITIGATLKEKYERKKLN